MCRPFLWHVGFAPKAGAWKRTAPQWIFLAVSCFRIFLDRARVRHYDHHQHFRGVQTTYVHSSHRTDRTWHDKIVHTHTSPWQTISWSLTHIYWPVNPSTTHLFPQSDDNNKNLLQTIWSDSCELCLLSEKKLLSPGKKRKLWTERAGARCSQDLNLFHLKQLRCPHNTPNLHFSSATDNPVAIFSIKTRAKCVFVFLQLDPVQLLILCSARDTCTHTKCKQSSICLQKYTDLSEWCEKDESIMQHMQRTFVTYCFHQTVRPQFLETRL